MQSDGTLFEHRPEKEYKKQWEDIKAENEKKYTKDNEEDIAMINDINLNNSITDKQLNAISINCLYYVFDVLTRENWSNILRR